MHCSPHFPYDPLRIGPVCEDPLARTHVADQLVVCFVVGFEPLPCVETTPDYRPLLFRLWSPYMLEVGLSAEIGHQAWHRDRGLLPFVTGWIWREHGTAKLGTVYESEILRIVALLREPSSHITCFNIAEQLTTSQFGRNLTQRRYCLRKGNCSIEAVSNEDAPLNLQRELSISMEAWKSSVTS